MPSDTSPNHLRLISSDSAPQKTRATGWMGAPPFSPLRFRLELFQIWMGFAHAAAAVLAIALPFFDLTFSIMILCAILLVAAMLKTLLATAYEGAVAQAYTVWGLLSALGGGAIIVLPVLSIATPAAVLAVYFALEAAATAYLAGAGGLHRRVWLPYAGLAAALSVGVLIWQHSMPLWAFCGFVGLDLLAAGVSYTRAGLAAFADGQRATWNEVLD